jgi:carbamoylphosphate synthase large subunit
MNKKWQNRTVRIFSRHPSHNILRKAILFPKIACVRFGSTSERASSWNKSPLQINTVEACKTSSNKLKMKAAFVKTGVNSPEHWISRKDIPADAYPVIAKKIYGSRALGIKMINSVEEFGNGNNAGTIGNLEGYYFEKYYNHAREYRLHCTEDEVFYTCRKMLKSGTPEEVKFFRNDSNCVWVLETNPAFDKPSNWNEICEESIKATKAVGLDIGAVDVRVKSNNTSEFKIIEVNSAPSFGNITAEKYAEIIPMVLKKKQTKLNLV